MIMVFRLLMLDALSFEAVCRNLPIHQLIEVAILCEDAGLSPRFPKYRSKTTVVSVSKRTFFMCLKFNFKSLRTEFRINYAENDVDEVSLSRDNIRDDYFEARSQDIWIQSSKLCTIVMKLFKFEHKSLVMSDTEAEPFGFLTHPLFRNLASSSVFRCNTLTRENLEVFLQTSTGLLVKPCQITDFTIPRQISTKKLHLSFTAGSVINIDLLESVFLSTNDVVLEFIRLSSQLIIDFVFVFLNSQRLPNRSTLKLVGDEANDISTATDAFPLNPINNDRLLRERLNFKNFELADFRQIDREDGRCAYIQTIANEFTIIVPEFIIL